MPRGFFKTQNQFLKRFIIECSQLWSEMNSPNEFQTFSKQTIFPLIYCILLLLLAAFSQRFFLSENFSQNIENYIQIFRHGGHCRHILIKKICVRCNENSIFFILLSQMNSVDSFIKSFFHAITERKSWNDIKRLNKERIEKLFVFVFISQDFAELTCLSVKLIEVLREIFERIFHFEFIFN